MRNGLTAADLKTTIFAYPTRASDIGYMVWRAEGRGHTLENSRQCRSVR
jgi:hypothetical protein